MAENKPSKDALVKDAVKAGLGTEEFLKGLKVENLETMLTALSNKEKEVEAKATFVKESTQPKNVTTVADLVKKKKVEVAK